MTRLRETHLRNEQHRLAEADDVIPPETRDEW